MSGSKKKPRGSEPLERLAVHTPVFALLPEYIFVANRRWVRGKALLVRKGMIVDIVVSSRLPHYVKILQLPGLALLPGFFNVHTHLEYTDTSFVKPKRPSFVAWLDAIFSWKRQRKPAHIPASLQHGIDLCLQNGIVAIGDHYCGAEIPVSLLQSPLKGIVFHEILSRDPAYAGDQLKRIQNRKTSFPSDPSAKLRFGVALHAPYSVSDTLLRNTAAWARKHCIPLTMHVGESREEGKIFSRGAGPLAAWLEEKSGVDWTIKGTDPIAYVARQGLWEGVAQAVHMNLAKKSHLPLLPRKRVPIAHSPKSHEYFGHPRFPLEMFLAKGYCVALGTDSLASNDGLNMFEELRAVRKMYPKVPLEKLWDMATVAGAKSLGYARAGLIQKGFAADIIGIPLKSRRPLLQKMLAHRGPVAFTMIDGKMVFPPPNC